MKNINTFTWPALWGLIASDCFCKRIKAYSKIKNWWWYRAGLYFNRITDRQFHQIIMLIQSKAATQSYVFYIFIFTNKCSKHEENTWKHPRLYCCESLSLEKTGSQEIMSGCYHTLGVLVVTVLKMLTSTRNRVTRSAMRPGIMSGGTTKLGSGLRFTFSGCEGLRHYVDRTNNIGIKRC